jgi:hypothetical protein
VGLEAFHFFGCRRSCFPAKEMVGDDDVEISGFEYCQRF